MRIRQIATLFFATCGFGSLAVPPANDNFANRTTLVGSSNEFTATLAEATVESYNGITEAHSPNVRSDPAASAWWTWTAEQSGPVTLQILELPPMIIKPFSPQSDWVNFHGINVWALTDIAGFPTNQWPVTPLSGFPIHAGIDGRWVTFTAEGGRNYQLQLAGAQSGSFRLRLVAQGEPLIFEHPRSQTVVPGGSAMFGVMAAGSRPFTYQWRKDGADLQSQTGATFVLNGIDASLAGGYSAIVSNVYGASTSLVASLLVSEPSAVPILSSHGMSNDWFWFAVDAESNRFYRIESSTNGLAWAPARYFPRDAFGRTSIIAPSNPSTTVSVTNDAAMKVFRARIYTRSNDQCINNLRRIRYAKIAWARQSKEWALEPVYRLDLEPYIPGVTNIGMCPAGGAYAFNVISTIPTCTEPGHLLEEPW